MQLLTLFGLLGLTTAHFTVEYPTWRGDSFADTASQWTFPCANVSELPADHPNRTSWPTTGGSIRIEGSHDWALTYVNLGLGTNVTNFNISLVPGFNQTGAGVFCIKQVGLEEALRASNRSVESLDGERGTLQIIQISTRGASLFNCADITFNSSAQVLGDDQCQNSTGVGGIAIENADAEQGPSPTESGGQTQPTGAAVRVGGSLVFAAVVGLVVAVVM